MAIALPVTSLYFGIHAVVFGLLSLRVGLFRNSVLSKGKPAEEYPEFKAMSAVRPLSLYTKKKLWSVCWHGSAH